MLRGFFNSKNLTKLVNVKCVNNEIGRDIKRSKITA